MTSQLSARITRTPRPHDRARAEDLAPLLAPLPADLRALAAGAGGAAPYLADLLEKEAAWLATADDDPEAALRAEISAARSCAPDQAASRLRQGKRRVALLTALADLGGVWPLETVTGALTDYADAACEAALRAGLAPLIRRGKLPGLTEDALEDAGGMVVLAMGKMGAHELNYSSDIDLICLFDETRFDRDDFHAARSGFVKATRSMAATLSDFTGEGYVFRTDLRLRPDPAVTPVCMTMEAAERYYESLGRTWERAAYIKARPCAGDAAAGARFLRDLRPFVWRRHLDFAAIQDAHDMRLAIREHKGLGGAIALPGHDMKLGRGGIREIEFFTQTRQLIAGGRDPDLRARGTCAGLAALAEKDWVPSGVADTLCDHYRAHRTVEHRLQMLRDAQTHRLPRDDEGFDRLAALMDTDAAALKTDLAERLAEVHELTEKFFAGSRSAPAQVPEGLHDFDSAVLDRWQTYPALRSARGAEVFERLKPELLARLSKAAKPDEALLAFDGFLAGLPAGVQLFSLLRANPQIADLLIDIVTTSPALAAHLSRNARVLDAVLDGDFFSDWPGEQGLCAALCEQLAAESDYERQLDSTRALAREWHFRIGVHLLRGLTDADTAAAQYADLARAVLSALWPVVTAHFARRHGPPPGRGAVILGMGSLGAGRLTPQSDLDLLVIYDPAEDESSDGPRPLSARAYYARLTQAMITAMTAPMAQGKLYEVDMRLRPSGTQGPVATSLASFATYQRNEAWTWEHLALTRSAVVAGPPDLAQDVEALRDAVLAKPREQAAVCRDVRDMRARIAGAKAPDGPLDAKIGAGRLQDIELFAQTGALLSGRRAPLTGAGLHAAAEVGLISTQDASTLRASQKMLWGLQCASRLLSQHTLSEARAGRAGMAFLLRVCEAEDLAALEDRLARDQQTAAAIITRALDTAAPEAAEIPATSEAPAKKDTP